MNPERETGKRRLGCRLIAGASLALLLAVLAFVAAVGSGLDEDPSTDGMLAVYVMYAALICAAAMLVGGLLTQLWKARKERMRPFRR